MLRTKDLLNRAVLFVNHQFDTLVLGDLSGEDYSFGFCAEVSDNFAGSPLLHIPTLFLAGNHMPGVLMPLISESHRNDFGPDPPSANRAVSLDGLDSTFRHFHLTSRYVALSYCRLF